MRINSIIIGLWLLAHFTQAQTMLSEADALRHLEEHPALRAAGLTVEQQTKLAAARPVWDHAEIGHSIAADPDLGMFGTSILGVTQKFPSQKQARTKQRYYQQAATVAGAEKDQQRQLLVREVRDLYSHLAYLVQKRAVLSKIDSIYQSLALIAANRHKAGEVEILEKQLAADEAQRMRLELQTISHETEFDKLVLGQILGFPGPVTPVIDTLRANNYSLADTSRIDLSPFSRVYLEKAKLSEAQIAIEKSKTAPYFTAGLNAQYIANGKLFPGYSFGVGIPLVKKGHKQQVSAAEIGALAAQETYASMLLQQHTELGHLLHEIEKYEIFIAYYHKNGNATSKALMRHAIANYKQGEISYREFLLLSEKSLKTELEYLENVYELNLCLINAEALLGIK